MITGIIGTGNMGTILVESLITSGFLNQEQVMINNRTPFKAAVLKEKYPGISIASSSVETAKSADLIFLCVKPHEMHPLLEIMEPHLTAEQCLVTITSPLSPRQLEKTVRCSCARLIPSITNRALSGASILTFGESCTEKWQQLLHDLASSFSRPLQIETRYTRVTSDIVSCGPAFFSYLARSFIDAAVLHTGINKEQATELTQSMLIGLGELLNQQHFTLPALQEKVCVKGGITGEGIKVLDEELEGVFKRLFEATEKKFEEDVGEVEEQFGVPYY